MSFLFFSLSTINFFYPLTFVFSVMSISPFLFCFTCMFSFVIFLVQTVQISLHFGAAVICNFQCSNSWNVNVSLSFEQTCSVNMIHIQSRNILFTLVVWVYSLIDMLSKAQFISSKRLFSFKSPENSL